MNNDNEIEKQDDEISLVDLLAVLVKHKFLILFTTLLALLVSVGYIFVDKVIVKPKQIANYVKAEEQALVDFGIEDGLYKSFGEILILEQNNIKSIEIAQKLLKSGDFKNKLLRYFDFMDYYESQDQFEEILNKYLTFNMDKATSIATISFSAEDSEFAYEVASFAVNYVVSKIRDLDTQLLLKADLTKVALYSSVVVIEPMESFEYVDFKADAIKKYSVASKVYVRNLVIVVLAALFLSIFAAFLINAIQNLKKDPEAMKKLRGEE